MDLLKNLEKLKKLDYNYSVFGSSTHRYHLNTPLSEKYLSKFEAIHNIRLPNDYRFFLNNIGNGIAGPSYGLTPLEEYFSTRKYRIEIGSDFLSIPFPYSRNNPYKYVDESDESIIYGLTGTITLCHHGCGYYDMLIVAGEEKGTVWLDATCSDGGINRISNSFSDWYNDWLIKSIQSLSN